MILKRFRSYLWNGVIFPAVCNMFNKHKFLQQRKEIWHLFCYFPHKELKRISHSLGDSWRLEFLKIIQLLLMNSHSFRNFLERPNSKHSICQAVTLKRSEFFIKIQLFSQDELEKIINPSISPLKIFNWDSYHNFAGRGQSASKWIISSALVTHKTFWDCLGDCRGASFIFNYLEVFC